VDPAFTNLKGRSSYSGGSSSYTTSSKGSGHDWGIGSFIIGCCLIPFSLACIWQNERKIVKFHEVITTARDAIDKDVDIAEI